MVSLIAANRVCFARRERMDFLLLIGTRNMLGGRAGFFLKVCCEAPRPRGLP